MTLSHDNIVGLLSDNMAFRRVGSFPGSRETMQRAGRHDRPHRESDGESDNGRSAGIVKRRPLRAGHPAREHGGSHAIVSGVQNGNA